ncbi:hypothetical protein ACQUSY_01550 [Microbacterium sp. YY-03]|uniref:hypothetical protein n=1 Tax=Microbacterium sp. YY-03 TaxID=3421636 RepID=UPI003D17E394
MARVSGRNPIAAWVVGVLCAAIVVAIVVVSAPLWGDLGIMVSDWWESNAPFQGE